MQNKYSLSLYTFILGFFIFSSCIIVVGLPNRLNPVSLSCHDINSITSWSWTSTELVSDGSDENIYSFSFVVDNELNVHVVWFERADYFSSGSDEDIFYIQWNSKSGSWTNIEVVSSESTDYSGYPEIAVDNSGNLHVVWYDSTNFTIGDTDTDIFYKKRVKTSGTWTNVEVVSTESTENSNGPDIAVAPSGDLFVVWLDKTNYDGAGSDEDIFFKQWFSANNTWGSTEVVSKESTSTSWKAEIAVGNNGDAHVVWPDKTDYIGAGIDQDIFYKRLDSNSNTWTGITIISEESSENSAPAKVDTDSYGSPHIVWQDYDDITGNSGGDYDIFYKKYNPSMGIWSSVELVSVESSIVSFDPDLSIDESDNVHIAWGDKEEYGGSGGDMDIFYRLKNSTSTTWSPLSVVSTESTDRSDESRIFVDDVGFIHVVWLDLTEFANAGSDPDIFYKRFSGLPKTPFLNPISPNLNLDGVINLDWNKAYGAYQYHVYRSNSTFSSIGGLTAITNVSTSYFTDSISTSGIYYYAIVAENPMGTSAISNTESVNVTLPMNDTVSKGPFGLPIDQETFNLIIIGALGLSLMLNVIFIFKRRK